MAFSLACGFGCAHVRVVLQHMVMMIGSFTVRRGVIFFIFVNKIENYHSKFNLNMNGLILKGSGI